MIRDHLVNVDKHGQGPFFAGRAEEEVLSANEEEGACVDLFGLEGTLTFRRAMAQPKFFGCVVITAERSERR